MADRATHRALLLVAAAMALLLPSATMAAGRLRAQYIVSLAGITIGRGGWEVEIDADRFTAKGSGGAAFLARLITSGHGTASAEGGMAGGVTEGQPMANRYDYASTTGKKFDTVHLRIADAMVTELTLDPPQPPQRSRVPLGPGDRIGVFDPISATLMRVAGSGETMAPEACQRTLSIFDGRMRYDLRFSFKRMEHVTTAKGYQGPAVVCAVRFAPIAGHVPDRAAIKYLVGLETMEMWLAPIAGTRLVVPYRVVIPTPFGTAQMTAEEFQTE
jgi:Protein of unknown function (DUF3108)